MAKYKVRALTCQSCSRPLRTSKNNIDSFKVITVPVLLCAHCDAMNILSHDENPNYKVSGGLH